MTIQEQIKAVCKAVGFEIKRYKYGPWIGLYISAAQRFAAAKKALLGERVESRT